MVQSLVTRDRQGFLAVKGKKDEEVFDYQSVFVRLVKTRRGQLSHDFLHMIHENDFGLNISKPKF